MVKTSMSPWEIWIDTGGTFTDCVARDPAGRLLRAKVLSTSALRARVLRVVAADALDVRLGHGLPHGFLTGFRLRILNEPTVPSETAHPGEDGCTGERPADVLSGKSSRAPEAVESGSIGPAADGGALVTRHTGSRIELSGAVAGELRPGARIELQSPEEAPLLAARLVTGTAAGRPLPPLVMRLATTLGTNALLERRGAVLALFVTRGHGDLLEIGTQQRPELFALEVRKPAPLNAATVEVPERVGADGSVLVPLDVAALQTDLDALRSRGIREAAVALLNAHAEPAHERRLAAALREAGFRHVSPSSDMSSSLGILARAQTAVVDAYLAPILREHLDRIRGAGVGRLHVLTSAGGLVEAGSFRPKDGLLSGPAGGVVGAAVAARRSGLGHAISFDMGGTSTDVARWDGDFEYEFEHEVAGVRLVAPALAVATVAAGGGSVCKLDGERLRVGPQSAGARPGPACYGAGGPLTLTDVNLLLGRLDPERFEIPLVPERARARADAIRDDLARTTGDRLERDPLLAGFLAIADERMADAIREVSVRRGYDPADYALVAFGGAGGQHACGVASRLGIGTVLVPADASLLSAIGLGHAALERFAERQVLEPVERLTTRLPALLDELAAEAVSRVREEAGEGAAIEVRRRILTMRLAGQESGLSVEHDATLSVAEAFRARYAAVFGHSPEERPIEVESVRVVASVAGTGTPERQEEGSGRSGQGDAAGAPRPTPASLAAEGAVARRDSAVAAPVGEAEAWFGGRRARVAVYDRSNLVPGAELAGPALVFERHTATVVDEGWRSEVDRARALVLRRIDTTDAPAWPEVQAPAGREIGGSAGARGRAVGSEYRTARARGAPPAVRLELFTNRLASIAREMGEQLRRTSLSTNVKERLDYSCALLDADGHLVVSAPHVPVHLGALGVCVRRVREALTLEPGDVAVTNHPGFGGSHLPDVTVITPIHSAGGRLLGYAANRAHHAEIGGTRPGSMPPFATSLAEEGVVLPPTHLVRGGTARWDEIRRLLAGAPHPSRAVEENLADMRSAVAANHRGLEALRALAAEAGDAEVELAMEALQARAARLLSSRLARLPRGTREAQERLDDGSCLRAAIVIEGGRATIDFAGSAPRHPGNLNATPAIVGSVVIYVLRLLVEEPLPLNDGLLRPVTVLIPTGSILDPGFPEDPALAPAVAGGNVETSQRLVDTLLKALGLAACSQGTMNNVLFGDASFGYYETVCGGCGAGQGFDGASAVHSHMTNTRITDPEVLERRYPVRLERFAVRHGSGGGGRFRGGDGVVRETTFLAPLTLSVVSQHRAERPYGLEGGAPGLPGRQRVVRASGEVVELGSVDGCEVRPGDRLVLETPGGGGYGTPARS